MRYKFKAWDNNSKKMAQVMAIDWYENGEIMSLHLKYGDGTVRKVYPNKEYGDDIELMQCIGLKDKTKKEVYEWYILETWYKRYPEYNKEFKGDLVVVKHHHGEYMLHYLMDWCGISNNIENLQSISNYKIIGSIYENPELIKTRKTR